MDRFYAIYDGDYDNFEKQFLFCKANGLLPDTMVAVADDPGGNMICLSVSGIDTNSVYFWDHEATDDDKRVNLHLIADSFAEFLAGLYQAPKYVVLPFDEILSRSDVGDLKALIGSGWDVDTLHEGRQDYPIETSAPYGKPEFVTVLLQHGAKVGRAVEIAERCRAMPHLAEVSDRDYEGVVRAIKAHPLIVG